MSLLIGDHAGSASILPATGTSSSPKAIMPFLDSSNYCKLLPSRALVSVPERVWVPPTGTPKVSLILPLAVLQIFGDTLLRHSLVPHRHPLHPSKPFCPQVKHSYFLPPFFMEMGFHIHHYRGQGLWPFHFCFCSSRFKIYFWNDLKCSNWSVSFLKCDTENEMQNSRCYLITSGSCGTVCSFV